MPFETKQLRIALLTDGIFPITIGGMQKHSYYLARNLAKLGVQIDLYYIPHNDPEEEKKLIDHYFSKEEKANIEFIQIPWPKKIKFVGHYLIESYNYSKRIFNYLVKQKPYDYIYAKGFSAWYLLRMKKKGVLFPLIGIKFHGYEMFQVSPSVKYSFEKFLLKFPVKWNNRNADQVFSYGGKITTLIKKLGVPEKKIIEIPTGIDESWVTQSFIPPPKNPVKFAFIGRYERRKGLKELNQTLIEMLGKEDFLFHFIGPVSQNKQIKAKNIFYHGSIIDQEKIKSIVDNSDVLVCPSYSEGMPNVIMEGMARGLAIIASDVGAINQQVSSENGILIEAGNKKQLHTAIESMLNMEPEKLQHMKQASKEKVKQNFLWEQVAERTIEEIRKLGR